MDDATKIAAAILAAEESRVYWSHHAPGPSARTNGHESLVGRYRAILIEIAQNEAPKRNGTPSAYRIAGPPMTG
jgi:hypothetical protein